MGDREAVEALKWLAHIGRTRNNIIHAGNGREVLLPMVQYVKVYCYCAGIGEDFEYLECFWHGFQ